MTKTELSAADSLRKVFSRYSSCVIAVSGGADSACLLLHAAEYFENQNITAVTFTGNHIFEYEIENAEKCAEKAGVTHVKISPEMPDEFYKNPADKCYICKKHILSELLKIKDKAGADVVFDGSTMDDNPQDRPGMRALSELNIVSPLKEAGLSSEYTAQCADTAGVRLPSQSCKATRIQGVITDEKLAMVKTCEDALRDKFPDIRIRVNDSGVYRIDFKEGFILSEEGVKNILNVLQDIK